MTDKTVRHRKPSVRLAVLGSLEVTIDGVPVNLGPPKQRLLLALLVCRANRIVQVDALTEALWADNPPRTSRKNLQVYVAALRKAIGNRIDHAGPGYVLRAEQEEVDVERFQMLAAAGRRLARRGDPANAALMLSSALRCWRGPALADFVHSPAAAAEAQRLASRFLSAYEDWAEALSELGRDTEILDSIEEVLDHHPFRERLSVAKMTALARCGRAAEALAYYDDVRQQMARELGLQPSPVLARLYRQILTGRAEVAKAPPGHPPRQSVGGRPG